MIILGLTGPSGTGKSTASLTAEELGYSVIDCDRVAATVTTDPQLLKSLTDAFGEVVSDGVLDRKALAERAFATPQSTELLNSIMLPAAVKAINKQIEALRLKGVTHLILDAPTLYESGADGICTAVIALLANEDGRSARILQRDGLTPNQLKSRLQAAKPDSFYTERAEHIVYNNGSLADLEAAVAEIFKKYKEC